MNAKEVLVKNGVFEKPEISNMNVKIQRNIEKSMIEFAKQIVKKALNKVYKEFAHGDDEHKKWLKNKFDSYNLDNIK